MGLGINKNKKNRTTDGLSHLLADTYTLYLKTHNYHWNVTGRFFPMLHLMFEEQYKELAIAIDVIAERIRALGEYAPGSYSQFKNLTIIKEETAVPTAMQMVENLSTDNEKLIQVARSTFSIAEKAQDEATLDLLTQRIQTHEKTAWMLKSILEPE